MLKGNKTSIAASLRFCSIAILTICISISTAHSHDTAPSSATSRAEAWTQDHLINATAEPPFSFIYNGRPSADFLPSWSKKIADTKLDSARLQHTISWTDPKTGLNVTCVAVQFADFPAAEWTVYLKNTGTANTPILEKFKAIDSQFPAENPGAVHLHYIDGDGESHGNLQFAPHDQALTPSAETNFSPLDGRPTDGCFPFYNLAWNGKGVIVVLGWPGQWSSSFTADTHGNVYVDGGQELTHLTLHPGEVIRSPRMAILFWEGGTWIDGQNVWRRWMRAHNMPKPDGRDIPVIRAGGGFMYDKLGWGVGLLNEKDQATLIDRYHQEGIKLNTWWMDIMAAGTFKPYTDKYMPNPVDAVVSWDTDLRRFPHGLRAVSERAGQLGEKLMVWFEPEHVMDCNILFQVHPGWLLSLPDDPAIKTKINQGVILGNRKIVNLGNPEARDRIIDCLTKLIDAEQIGIYRQDFNITPLIFWRHNDTSDRQGMTENLYVQGYLRLLDTLQSRFPRLLIDTCASGGRRDDMETLRRAVPLWRSDQWGPDVVQQTQSYGLALWVPYFGTGTHVIDPYAYRSSLGSSLMTSWDVRDPHLDYPQLRKLETEFWKASPFFREDYYPLTTFDADPASWMAWQYNRPGQGDGMVQAFRRDKAGDTARTFPLQHLDPSAQYQIAELNGSAPYTALGNALMSNGLSIEIKDKPGATVIIYKKAK